MRQTVVLLTALTGALAQFVDGVLGMGYGVSAATVLTVFGLAPAFVSATVHLAKLPSSAVSALAHVREGNVDRSISIPLAAGGVVGGVAGALVLSHFASAGIRPLVAVVLLILGVRMLVCAAMGKRPAPDVSVSDRRLAVIGVVGGSLDAFGGGGWGPTCMSVLMNGDGREPRRLVGSVNVAEVAMTAAVLLTLATRLGSGFFVWGAALPLLAGGVLAAPLAARVCSKVRPGVLAGGVGTAIVALNASVLAESLGLEWTRPVFWSLSVVVAVFVTVHALRRAERTVEPS